MQLPIGKFIPDKLKSLVSKTLGVTAAAEAVVATANPSLQGWPSIAYIVAQRVYDGWVHYVDRRWPAADE